MKRPAVVFPGQGSQKAGMAQELCRDFAAARQVFEEASQAAGLDLAKLCFEDPDHQLELTEFTQPCVLTASLAAWRVLAEETGIAPAAAAGHSLGEYAALAAAGAISVADAARIARLRGQWMQAACPPGQGAMAAALGLAWSELSAICREAGAGEVVAPANDNAPGQVAISGHAGAVARAVELIKARGGKARALKVSGPFHTELMRPAADKLAELLATIRFQPPAFPVIANAEAAAYPGPDAIAAGLKKQLTAPVRWRESVEAMVRQGVDGFIEVGPGTVLAGLIKRTVADLAVLPMSAPGHLAAIKGALQDGG